MAPERVDAVVVGAGHAGLAASAALSERGIDHLVLERGEVANSWRRERWDSLRLLTPNWLNRLPGLDYDGPEPDGYMSAADVVALLERYAAQIDAPVRGGHAVRALIAVEEGYEVRTDHGTLLTPAVVLASGAFNRAAVPAFAEAVPAGVQQETALSYRRPEDLPRAGVLVVGASATGAQLAAELQRSGRQVHLSVGEHVRMPRTYRGRDILWWMHHSGIWDQRHDELEDLTRARRLPSPQLVGTPERATLDLNALIALGVQPVGRWAALRDGEALFSGGLRNVVALADLKLDRLLDGFDAWVAESGREAEVGPVERYAPTELPGPPRLRLALDGGAIGSVLWATGARPDYGWLEVPCVDAKGQLRHDGGVLDQPGLYALGLPVLRRRRSTFLNGIEEDAAAIIAHLAGYLDGRRTAALSPAATG